jgi:hypothetical protein
VPEVDRVLDRLRAQRREEVGGRVEAGVDLGVVERRDLVDEAPIPLVGRVEARADRPVDEGIDHVAERHEHLEVEEAHELGQQSRRAHARVGRRAAPLRRVGRAWEPAPGHRLVAVREELPDLRGDLPGHRGLGPVEAGQRFADQQRPVGGQGGADLLEPELGSEEMEQRLVHQAERGSRLARPGLGLALHQGEMADHRGLGADRLGSCEARGGWREAVEVEVAHAGPNRALGEHHLEIAVAGAEAHDPVDAVRVAPAGVEEVVQEEVVGARDAAHGELRLDLPAPPVVVDRGQLGGGLGQGRGLPARGGARNRPAARGGRLGRGRRQASARTPVGELRAGLAAGCAAGSAPRQQAPGSAPRIGAGRGGRARGRLERRERAEPGQRVYRLGARFGLRSQLDELQGRRLPLDLRELLQGLELLENLERPAVCVCLDLGLGPFQARSDRDRRGLLPDRPGGWRRLQAPGGSAPQLGQLGPQGAALAFARGQGLLRGCEPVPEAPGLLLLGAVGAARRFVGIALGRELLAQQAQLRLAGEQLGAEPLERAGLLAGALGPPGELCAQGRELLLALPQLLGLVRHGAAGRLELAGRSLAAQPRRLELALALGQGGAQARELRVAARGVGLLERHAALQAGQGLLLAGDGPARGGQGPAQLGLLGPQLLAQPVRLGLEPGQRLDPLEEEARGLALAGRGPALRVALDQAPRAIQRLAQPRPGLLRLARPPAAAPARAGAQPAARVGADRGLGKLRRNRARHGSSVAGPRARASLAAHLGVARSGPRPAVSAAGRFRLSSHDLRVDLPTSCELASSLCPPKGGSGALRPRVRAVGSGEPRADLARSEPRSSARAAGARSGP